MLHQLRRHHLRQRQSLKQSLKLRQVYVQRLNISQSLKQSLNLVLGRQQLLKLMLHQHQLRCDHLGGSQSLKQSPKLRKVCVQRLDVSRLHFLHQRRPRRLASVRIRRQS